MIKEGFEQLFTRNLIKLRQEIEAYEEEGDIWKTMNGINNPAGNLCLHLIGNLNNYVGAVLGGTGYIRKRDLEFSLKHVPRALLLEDVDKTIIVIKETLSKLPEGQLNEIYPSEDLGAPLTVLQFLMHMVAHFNYHLGQVNYHRRLVKLMVSGASEN